MRVPISPQPHQHLPDDNDEDDEGEVCYPSEREVVYHHGSDFHFPNDEWCWASLRAQLVKNLPAMQETSIRFLGQENPLEKG